MTKCSFCEDEIGTVPYVMCDGDWPGHATHLECYRLLCESGFQVGSPAKCAAKDCNSPIEYDGEFIIDEVVDAKEKSEFSLYVRDQQKKQTPKPLKYKSESEDEEDLDSDDEDDDEVVFENLRNFEHTSTSTTSTPTDSMGANYITNFPSHESESVEEESQDSDDGRDIYFNFGEMIDDLRDFGYEPYAVMPTQVTWHSAERQETERSLEESEESEDDNPSAEISPVEHEQSTIGTEGVDAPWSPVECTSCGDMIDSENLAVRCRCGIPPNTRSAAFRHAGEDCNPVQSSRCIYCRGHFSRENMNVSEVTEVSWAVDFTSPLWDPKNAVPQGNAALCYAAAAATLSKCCGFDTNLDECAHFFAISDQNGAAWKAEYLHAYSEARASLGGDVSIAKVREVMAGEGAKREWRAAYAASVGNYGAPVFPKGLATTVGYTFTWSDLHTYLTSNFMFIVATSNHWYVVFGCRKDTQGVEYLKLYDPMLKTVNEEVAMGSKDWSDFVAARG